MQNAKKTEDELRHDIRREFSYSEERDKDNIDKILELKKDRYTATQAKKKAQEELELSKESKDKEPKGKYSLDDIDDFSALSSVPKEDRDWVLKAAEVEGKKPAEVLGLGYVKTYLKEKAEEKVTAEATNTKKSGRSATTLTPETIVQQAREKGEPETAEEAEALAKAEMEIKLAKSKSNRL